MIKRRIIQDNDRYFPQWKWPLFEIWNYYYDVREARLSYSTLTEARAAVRKWAEPVSTKIHSAESE